MEEIWNSTAPEANTGYMTVESLHRDLGKMICEGKGALSIEVEGNVFSFRPYLCQVTAEIAEPLEDLVPTTYDEWTAVCYARRLVRGVVEIGVGGGLNALSKVDGLLKVMDMRLKASQGRGMEKVAA